MGGKGGSGVSGVGISLAVIKGSGGNGVSGAGIFSVVEETEGNRGTEISSGIIEDSDGYSNSA